MGVPPATVVVLRKHGELAAETPRLRRSRRRGPKTSNRPE